MGKIWGKEHLILGVVLCLWAAAARADAARETLPAQDFFMSPRAAALGGVGAAPADDGYAIFVNPAGIGREDGDKPKGLLRAAVFPNVTLGINPSTMELYDAFMAKDEGKAKSIEDTILAAQDTETVWGHVSLFPYVTIGRFQLGVFAGADLQGYVSRFDAPRRSAYATPQSPLTYDAKIALQARSVVAAVAGASFPMGASLQGGLTARYATRATSYRSVEASRNVARDASEDYLKNLNKTSGLGLDAGVIFKPAKNKWGPEAVLAVRDVGDTVYKAKDDKSHDETEKMNVVVGGSLRPPLGARSGLLMAAEAVRLTDDRLAWRDKLRLGVEWGLGASDVTAPFALRVGHNLRAFSAGVGADLVFLKLDASYFGAPVDGENGVRVDTRFLFRMSVDLRS